MGYFRFRRSFKILPGVKWNLGKKSSSVSVGGRGFHYTIGSEGARTTVGLPGIGLSYTSVNRRKRDNRLSDSEMAKAMAWSQCQAETFHLDLPDRAPDEAPATEEQRAIIQRLVQSISGSELPNLGIIQAEYLIKEIKREKALFTERKIHEYLDQRQNRSGMGCLLFIVAVVFIGYVLSKASH